MKRRGFLAVLAGLVAAPKVLELPKSDPEADRVEFVRRMWEESDPHLRERLVELSFRAANDGSLGVRIEGDYLPSAGTPRYLVVRR